MFSNRVLVGNMKQRVCLVVNEVWIDKEPTSLIRMKNQQNQSVTEWYKSGKCAAMDKGLSLCCD